MKEHLHVEFGRSDRTYRFGETISGRVLLGAPRGEQCQAVRLRTFWATHGKGNEDKGNLSEILLHSGPLSGDRLHEFEFEFPAPPGPFTYHGRYLNVDQYVEVQVDLPWARDPKQREEYLLLPGTPVAPPRLLLEHPENSVGEVLPGCSAFAGATALSFGVLMLFFSDAIGFVALLVGLFFSLPWLKGKADRRLGDASAYLTSLVVCPGDEAGVEVRVSPKKPVHINRALMELTAREICVSGSGSSRRTHHHTVFSGTSHLSGAVILEGEKVNLLRGGVRVPPEVPVSFKGGANKLLWEAKVQLDIPGWPDWVKKIPLVVWPAGNLVGDGEEMEALPYPEDEDLALVSSVPEGEPSFPEPEPPIADPPPWLADPEPALMEIEAGAFDIEPAQVKPPGVPSTALSDAVRAIHGADIFGGVRDHLIKGLTGRVFDLSLEVKRVDRSFGVFSDAEYRDGQTVTGILVDSGLEVVVLFPGQQNEEVRGWQPGSLHEVRGEVRDWDRLRKRPELLARG